MPQTPFYPQPCPWPVRPADVPKPVMTVNNKKPDEHGNVEVEGGGGGGGDVKHSDFADMQTGGKMDLDTVGAKVDQLITRLKGTASLAFALLSLSSFAALGPTTRFGAVHPDTTLREVVVAGGVPTKVSDLENDSGFVDKTVTNGLAAVGYVDGFRRKDEKVAWSDVTNSFAVASNALGSVAIGTGSVAANRSNAFATGAGTLASGSYSFAAGAGSVASQSGSFAVGIGANSSNDLAFVWNGCTGFYGSHGERTFNVCPEGGTDGFWVGGTNLTALLASSGGRVTKVSELTNDAGYVTSAVTNGLASTGWTTNWVGSLGYVTASVTNGLAGTNMIPLKVSALTNDAGYVTAAIIEGFATTSYVGVATADLRHKDDDQTYVPMPRGPFAAFSHEYSVTVAEGSQPAWIPPALDGEMGHFSWSMALKDGDAVVASGEFVSDPFPDDTPTGFVMHREQDGTTYYVNAERAMVLEPDGDRYARYGETDSRFSNVERDVADRRVKDDMSVWTRGHSDFWEWDGFDKSVLEITGAPHLEDDHGTTYLYCDARYVPTSEALNLKSVFPCDASTFDTVLEAPVAGRTVGAHFFRREIWVESEDRLATTGGIHTVATNVYTKAETDGLLAGKLSERPSDSTYSNTRFYWIGNGLNLENGDLEMWGSNKDFYNHAGDIISTDGDGVEHSLTGKANRYTPSTPGNLASLTADGDLADSGIAKTNVATTDYVNTLATNRYTKAESDGLLAGKAGIAGVAADGNIAVFYDDGTSVGDSTYAPGDFVLQGDFDDLGTRVDEQQVDIAYLGAAKANTVSGATAGNLASLAPDGDLEDSGISKDDVVIWDELNEALTHKADLNGNPSEDFFARNLDAVGYVHSSGEVYATDVSSNEHKLTAMADRSMISATVPTFSNAVMGVVSATNAAFAAEVRSVVIETLKESLKIVQKSDGYHLVIEE